MQTRRRCPIFENQLQLSLLGSRLRRYPERAVASWMTSGLQSRPRGTEDYAKVGRSSASLIRHQQHLPSDSDTITFIPLIAFVRSNIAGILRSSILVQVHPSTLGARPPLTNP